MLIIHNTMNYNQNIQNHKVICKKHGSNAQTRRAICIYVLVIRTYPWVYSINKHLDRTVHKWYIFNAYPDPLIIPTESSVCLKAFNHVHARKVCDRSIEPIRRSKLIDPLDFELQPYYQHVIVVIWRIPFHTYSKMQ